MVIGMLETIGRLLFWRRRRGNFVLRGLRQTRSQRATKRSNKRWADTTAEQGRVRAESPATAGWLLAWLAAAETRVDSAAAAAPESADAVRP